MEKNIKKTPLHTWHAEHNGNLVSFGEYMMPLWYSSVKEEHLKILKTVGMFDTSHMAVVMINGPDAFDLIQLSFTRDLNACIGKAQNPIEQGRCVYGAFLNEKGECLDDAIVYKIAGEEFMIVVNSGMGANIVSHMESYKDSRNVHITDLSNKIGKFDVQGPMAAKTMQKVLKDPDSVFEKMIYFSFKGHFDKSSPFAAQVQMKDGTPLMLSRSGYTGEFGFEIFIAAEHTEKAWKTVMEAGREFDIIPCGLAARDSLRAGALLPLSHQDIGQWMYRHHPWTFALPFTQDKTAFTKSFVGDKILLNGQRPQYTSAFVGKDLRKVDAHNAIVLDENEKKIGTVLTCATDMAIGRHEDRIYSIVSPDKPQNFKARGLCCGFIKTDIPLQNGQVITLKDSKRKIDVYIVDDIRPNRTARLSITNFLA